MGAVALSLVSLGLSVGVRAAAPDLSTSIEPEYLPTPRVSFPRSPPQNTLSPDIGNNWGDLAQTNEAEYLPPPRPYPDSESRPDLEVTEPEYTNLRPVQKAPSTPPPDVFMETNEPEYTNIRSGPRRASPIIPKTDYTGKISDVKEYVDKFEGLSAFLEVSSSVGTTGHDDQEFLEAVLTDDLAKEMKNVKEGEKYVFRHDSPSPIATTFSSKTTNSNNPEPPSALSPEQKIVFQQLAEKYERNLHGRLSNTPSSTDPHSIHVVHTYEIRAEPQVLLPVPASVLYEAVAKYRAKVQAAASAEEDQQKKTDDKTTQNIEQEFERILKTEQNPTFLDIKSEAKSGSKTEEKVSAGGKVTEKTNVKGKVAPMLEGYGGPYAAAQTGYMMNYPGAGQVSNTESFSGMVPAPHAPPAIVPGLTPPQVRMAPQNFPELGIYSLGVASPAPPLRPDNLPPPPYVRPLVVGSGEGGGKGGKGGKKGKKGKR